MRSSGIKTSPVASPFITWGSSEGYFSPGQYQAERESDIAAVTQMIAIGRLKRVRLPRTKGAISP
ncbi:MAG: hypothetical protein MZV63_68405 [Marinilabiliales bacterium]|nr:hypothetical protein [Marinilabiliales bacterium]